MHEFSLDYLRCVKCHSKLEVEILREEGQIDEGFLFCTKCTLAFPVIDKIPILWDDFNSYLSNRPRLGGELLLKAKTQKMKSFVKKSLGKITKNLTDISIIEKRWSGIYQLNKKSRFYSKIKGLLKETVNPKTVLEHGCSIGHITQHLAKTSMLAFGIDKSYHAISIAKKTRLQNLDFIVADSLEPPFGKTRFDLVVGLNLFEIIEPKPLLKLLAGQVRKNGFLAISDPYDFERGAKSVKEPLTEDSIRDEILKHGFTISRETKKPSFVLWNLHLHSRASLHYKVDLIVAKKQ